MEEQEEFEEPRAGRKNEERNVADGPFSAPV
jgi:hypothetical protein